MSTRQETEYDLDFSDPQIAVAVVLGAFLTLIGILAPVVAGESGEFLGFGRNYLHDLIHLGSGLAGLVAGYYAGGRLADEYNIAMGGIYGAVVILGFVATDLMNDLIALNQADNYMHLLFTFVFLGVGAFAERE